MALITDTLKKWHANGKKRTTSGEYFIYQLKNSFILTDRIYYHLIDIMTKIAFNSWPSCLLERSWQE